MAKIEREKEVHKDQSDLDIALATFRALKEALEGNDVVDPLNTLDDCMNGTCDNPDCPMCDAISWAHELVERAQEQRDGGLSDKQRNELELMQIVEEALEKLDGVDIAQSLDPVKLYVTMRLGTQFQIVFNQINADEDAE